MQKNKGGKRRTGYVYNGAVPNTLDAVPLPRPEAVEFVKDAGSIKAQLIGKLGSRGYGRLLAGMRQEVVEETK